MTPSPTLTPLIKCGWPTFRCQLDTRKHFRWNRLFIIPQTFSTEQVSANTQITVIAAPTDVPEIGAHQFWMHLTVLELMGIWHEISELTTTLESLCALDPLALSVPQLPKIQARSWEGLSPWLGPSAPALPTVRRFSDQANQLNQHWRTPLGGAASFKRRFPSSTVQSCVVETAKCNLCPKLCLVVILLGGLRLAILQRWIRCCKYVSDW